MAGRRRGRETGEDPQDWESALARRIGMTVKSARQRAGMSQGALADALGVHRSQVVNIEMPERLTSGGTLRVGLLLRIAAALGVPPIFLLYPGLADDQIDVLPGLRSSSRDAARWFNGETITATTSDGEEQRLAHVDDTARELVEAVAQLARLDEAIAATARTMPIGDDGQPVDDGRQDRLVRDRDDLEHRIVFLTMVLNDGRA